MFKSVLRIKSAGMFGVLLLLFVIGCGSVPIATIWRMRDFSADDLMGLDPNSLEIQLIHRADIRTKDDGTRFGVKIFEDGENIRKFEFPLKVIERVEETKGWIRKKKWMRNTLVMSDAGVKDFLAFQKKIKASEGKFKGAQINVSSGYEPFDKNTVIETLELSILIRLYEGQDYITLVDHGKISITPQEQR